MRPLGYVAGQASQLRHMNPVAFISRAPLKLVQKDQALPVPFAVSLPFFHGRHIIVDQQRKQVRQPR